VYDDPFLKVLPFAILLLPLGGFVVLALFGDWIRRDKEENGAGWLACATVLTSFGLAAWTTARLYGLVASETGLRFFQPYLGFEWMEAGGFSIPFSLLVDPLSCVMMLVVTGVGSLIHIYSLGYMAHDEERVRYFSYLNLFTFFMLLLVLGGNLPLMFVGWEGVGLCSYLLIGFWYRKQSAAAAGLKAFVVNRIGDVGLILGMAFMFHAFGTLDLVDIADNAGALVPEALWEFGPATIACLLLFVGATGKSAQIPLHVWLPDAMEGPTPVSALIHAATMVTAGVYMVARSNVLYQLASNVSMLVAVIGALTAIFAATMGLAQTDIKKVLAYSTVSQLGYMFLAAGVGAYWVAIFHLATHAFFKGLMFLGSGSVIHAMGGEQDMRYMGGLRKYMPTTYWTFLVGTLAIAGVPGFAGFFSKDQILASTFMGHKVLWMVGLVTAGLTALYMFRLLFMTFWGEFRGSEEQRHHLHESPPVMTIPLVVLAVGAVISGWFGLPKLGHWDWNAIGHYLEPVTKAVGGHGEAHHPSVGLELALMALSVVVAGLGIFIAWRTYGGDKGLAAGQQWAERFPVIHRLLANKYYVDELYDATVVKGTWSTARGLAKFDTSVVDGLVNGSRHVTVGTAFLSGFFDKYVVDGLVNFVGWILHRGSYFFRRLQTGLVSQYALVIVVGMFVLVLFYVVVALRG